MRDWKGNKLARGNPGISKIKIRVNKIGKKCEKIVNLNEDLKDNQVQSQYAYEHH